MSFERRPIVLLVAAVALAACADFSRGDPPLDAGADTATGAADGAGAAFAAVHPLLLSGCQSCHADGQEAGDTQLLLTGDEAADYAVTLPFVDVAAPASSRLLSKMSGSGHRGGAVYAVGTPEYETVLRWIEGGALP